MESSETDRKPIKDNKTTDWFQPLYKRSACGPLSKQFRSNLL
jgi:hypothetical protein